MQNKLHFTVASGVSVHVIRKDKMSLAEFVAQTWIPIYADRDGQYIGYVSHCHLDEQGDLYIAGEIKKITS